MWRPGFPQCLGLAAALLWVFAGGRFPERPTDPPARRLSTLERLTLPRLAATHADVERLAARRRTPAPLPGLRDFRVIFHAHAEDSVHTGGTRPEMLADAKAAGVDAIFLSDHFRPPRDFMDSWRGLRDGVLFVPGSEARGFLIHPMTSVLGSMEAPPSVLLPAVRSHGGMAFLSHIEERPDHPMDELDGLEIYNRHWDAKKDRSTLIALALKLTSPPEIARLEEAVRRFPDEALAAQIEYPSEYLEKWDTHTPARRLTGIAANDAHHNQVFVVKMVDDSNVLLGTIVDPDDRMQKVSALIRPGIRELTKGHRPGDTVVRIDFDPYVHSFRSVSTHVWAGELTEPALREAVLSGHVYVAHDWMGDPNGFRFTALAPTSPGRRHLPGTELRFEDGIQLEAEFPLPCSRIRLIRNGAQIDIGRGHELRHTVREPGVYRIEGWLSVDAEERCWILGNPIYIRGAPRPPPR